MYHYTDGGLRNVWLVNGFETRQTPYGQAVAIHDQEGLSRAICQALVKQPRPLTRTEFRYLRTAGLMVSQAALAATLGVDAQTVARWEKSARIPKMADAMMRLIYLEHASGNVRLTSAFEMLRTIERASSRAVPQRVVVEAVDEHWQPRVENDMPQTDGSPTHRNARQHAARELAALGSAIKDMKTVPRRRPTKRCRDRSAEHNAVAL